MLYSLHHKKKIIGLFDNLESCNKMVTGLESNKFINYKDIKIRTYVENSIILISDDKFNNYKNEKNNDTDYESDSVYSDSLRSTKSSRYSDDDHENDDNNKEEDNKKEDNKKEDNKEEDNKEEDNNILKLDKDQIEKMSKSEEYLKIYKDKQEVKLKKEKIEIEKRKILNKKKQYDTDIKLYNMFKKNINEDKEFQIPELFQYKYDIFKNLDDQNKLSMKNFNLIYKPKNYISSYDALF